MTEYLFVEKPFLDHLHSLGWEVIDQGVYAIPSDPATSLRDDFRCVTLRLGVFCRETVRGINLLPDGSPWLTDAQLAGLHDELTIEMAGKPLIEANQVVTRKLIGQTWVVVGRNERTGEEYPEVRLVDSASPNATVSSRSTSSGWTHRAGLSRSSFLTSCSSSTACRGGCG